MKFRPAAIAMLSFAALSTAPSWAQNVKPGLWEVKNKMSSPDPRLAAQMEMLQQQLANMPPEQRKMLEAMAARHTGINMPTMQDGGMLVKICMSREMAEQQRFPMPEKGNCTHQRAPVINNAMKVSFTCTEPDASGEGELRFMGEKAYALKMNVTSAAMGGKKTMTMDATGTWLGADCGDVKPVPMSPVKAKP